MRIIGVTPIAPKQDGHYRYREVLEDDFAFSLWHGF
jgi:hypothetical protein